TGKLLKQNTMQLNAEFATEYLFFKCRKNSIWNSQELRIALLEAVPWEKLREQSFVKATTLVYPINGYPQPTGFSYTDINEAKTLMESARKKLNIPQKKVLPLVIAIIDTDYMKKQAELLIEAWKDLGVDVQIQSTPATRYLSSISDWEADIFAYTWIGDFADPLAFLELFRSDSTLNVANWKNSEYDKLLLEAASYTDSTRAKLLSQAEQVLLDSGIILPVSHPVSFNIIDLEAVGGWQANAFDIHLFKYMFKKKQRNRLPNIAIR
ncbi:MAG: peptide ABC transporter substrate-binding protein, partial [Treponema sp.]|nr:peptide ABC transporter substrate-binding protein [Treponema sp.]